ncbi:LysE family translocator [Paenibacillus medicaginis]|uniref:LysE family translocator n=1 Tax=Paenibacillus medicaginis TaxID=1470560 RepID=A0ABV5BU49_9BACL
MFSLSAMMLFIGASVLLILVPGPDLIFTVTQGITNGRKAGVMTAIGLSLGNTVHTLAAALGLSIIVQTSATVFTVFKVAGACYLFYLAYQSFIHRKDRSVLAGASKQQGFRLLFKGMTMNVLNPKVAIFFLAFLPQFVNYSYGYVPLQMIVLGVVFMVLTAIIFGLLGYFAGVFNRRLLHSDRFNEWLACGASAIFVLLGIKLITTKA